MNPVAQVRAARQRAGEIGIDPPEDGACSLAGRSPGPTAQPAGQRPAGGAYLSALFAATGVSG